MERALIQIQDITGNWQTVQTIIKQDQLIKRTIDTTAKQYKKLVRAVDDSGNILQLGGL
jgi:hypothetical protein